MAWRKRARDTTLPPVLVLYLSVLGKHLIIDGHDRAHAALLEGVEPPLCVLWPAWPRGIDPGAVADLERLHDLSAEAPALPWPEILNRDAARAYNWFSTHFAYTRAYPIRGGIDGWTAEVSNRLDAARGEIDPADFAFCLDSE